jgi:hypothetical protein
VLSAERSVNLYVIKASVSPSTAIVLTILAVPVATASCPCSLALVTEPAAIVPRLWDQARPRRLPLVENRQVIDPERVAPEEAREGVDAADRAACHGDIGAADQIQQFAGRVDGGLDVAVGGRDDDTERIDPVHGHEQGRGQVIVHAAVVIQYHRPSGHRTRFLLEIPPGRLPIPEKSCCENRSSPPRSFVEGAYSQPACSFVRACPDFSSSASSSLGAPAHRHGRLMAQRVEASHEFHGLHRGRLVAQLHEDLGGGSAGAAV